MHAAISQDRGDIAVAGARGLAVYARRAQRWRMFGDVAQERQLRVGAAAGLDRRLRGALVVRRASAWPALAVTGRSRVAAPTVQRAAGCRSLLVDDASL